MTLKNLLDAYLLVPIINLMDANVPVWLPLQSQSSQWDNGSLKLFYGQWTIELANKFIIGACHCSNKQCMLNAHTHRQLSFIVPSSDPTLATLASLQNLRISSEESLVQEPPPFTHSYHQPAIEFVSLPSLFFFVNPLNQEIFSLYNVVSIVIFPVIPSAGVVINSRRLFLII